MKAIRNLCAPLALCAGLLSTPLHAEEPTRIQFMEVIHSLFYSPLYVAKGLGYFEKEGLAFDLVAAMGSDKATAALLSGSADIALVGPETTVYVENGKSPVKLRMFSGLTATDGSFLMGREPAESFDWASLKGATIMGWREGSSPALFLREALTKAGLDPDKDVEIVTNIAIPARSGAFLAGSADYGTFFEPDVSTLEASGKLYALANVGGAVGQIDYTVFVAREEYIAEHPEIVQGFTDAIARAQAWLKEATPEQAAEVLAPFFPGVEAGALAQTVTRHRESGVWKETPLIEPAAIERLQDLLIASDILPADQRVAYDKVVDPSFAEKAMK